MGRSRAVSVRPKCKERSEEQKGDKIKCAWESKFLTCVFEWMLLIKETWSRLVREKDKVSSCFFLDCKFLEKKVLSLVHWPVPSSIHAAIQHLLGTYSVSNTGQNMLCVYCVFVLFRGSNILIIAWNRHPVVFAEWILWKGSVRLRNRA